MEEKGQQLGKNKVGNTEQDGGTDRNNDNLDGKDDGLLPSRPVDVAHFSLSILDVLIDSHSFGVLKNPCGALQTI